MTSALLSLLTGPEWAFLVTCGRQVSYGRSATLGLLWHLCVSCPGAAEDGMTTRPASLTGTVFDWWGKWKKTKWFKWSSARIHCWRITTSHFIQGSLTLIQSNQLLSSIVPHSPSILYGDRLNRYSGVDFDQSELTLWKDSSHHRLALFVQLHLVVQSSC